MPPAPRRSACPRPPAIDLPGLRRWKAEVIDRMAAGLAGLTKTRGVHFVRGRAEFESSDSVQLHDGEVSHIRFRKAGSSPARARSRSPGRRSPPADGS